MVVSINTFAQMGIGTPYNFYSLSGIQYNPGIHPEGGNSYYHNMWVTTIEDIGLSKCEIKYLKERFENDYPNHTILEDSTAIYNCHGYSFSVAQGSTLQGFLQSGKLADPADLDYIFNKARTL